METHDNRPWERHAGQLERGRYPTYSNSSTPQDPYHVVEGEDSPQVTKGREGPGRGDARCYAIHTEAPKRGRRAHPEDDSTFHPRLPKEEHREKEQREEERQGRVVYETVLDTISATKAQIHEFQATRSRQLSSRPSGGDKPGNYEGKQHNKQQVLAWLPRTSLRPRVGHGATQTSVSLSRILWCRGDVYTRAPHVHNTCVSVGVLLLHVFTAGEDDRRRELAERRAYTITETLDDTTSHGLLQTPCN